MTVGGETGYRAFRIAFDGRDYHGMQRQPDVPTVSDALIDAFAAHGVDVFPENGPQFTIAGRTDAGVSAAGQVIAAPCPDWLGPGALNAELPAEIRAWAVATVPAHFHPRHDAIEREYAYHLPATNLDPGRIRLTLERLTGTHDFHNLSAVETDTVRTITHSRLVHRPDRFVIILRSPGFLRQQVRRIVGLAQEIGRGTREPSGIDQILDPTVTMSGPEGIPAAPATGLVLRTVSYADVSFEPFDDRRRVFADQAIESGRRSWVLRDVSAQIDSHRGVNSNVEE